MQSLKNRAPKADPAPSRWSWRLQRLMLTPGFRFGLRFGVPFVLTLVVGIAFFSNPQRQQSIRDSVADARASIQERPEFMVNLLAIDGVEEKLSEDIRANLSLDLPISSFDLDLEALRLTINNLPPVADASLRIRPGGVLEVNVIPRVPVAVWRDHARLSLIDATGAHVEHISFRADRADLPLVAGEGANVHVGEALELMGVAESLESRMRGLVRVGDRRWDLVLDREQRILLPTQAPVRALERVIALDKAQDVLSRDVARVDLRLGQRPTVKMNKNATEQMWRIQQLSKAGQ